MAKLEKASDDIIEFIENIVMDHGIDHFAEFRFFELPKQKEAIRVARANATSEYFAKTSDMCTVFVNPKIWDRLDDEQKTLLVENALCGIYYDNDKGRLVVGQPNLMIASDCYTKFGAKLVDAAEIAMHALEQIKEEERKEKEEARAKKKGNAQN